MDLLEHKWDNRDENGMELKIDGYGAREPETGYEQDFIEEVMKLEVEPDLED